MEDTKIKEILKKKIGIADKYISDWTNSRRYTGYYPPDDEELILWTGSIQNIFKQRFGDSHRYYQDFINQMNTRKKQYTLDELSRANGVIRYVLEAMDLGLTDDLFYQREIILFDNFLDQAYEFLKKGYRDASAIYGRIVLETTIKEYAKKVLDEDIDKLKFSNIIELLWKKGIINKPFWRGLQAKYDLGSLSAHGEEGFKDISDDEIKQYLNFIRERVLTL